MRKLGTNANLLIKPNTLKIADVNHLNIRIDCIKTEQLELTFYVSIDSINAIHHFVGMLSTT